MAFDAFIKIDGIPGECTDDKHKDWIEILSFHIGADQPASASASTAGGVTAERVDVHDFHIVKALDKASPKLFEQCCTGKHIPNIVIELCRSGGDKLKYMEYKLTNSIISSVHSGGTAKGQENLPVEEVTINFGKIEIAYTQQKRTDGTGGGNVSGGWDLQKNIKA